MSKQFEISETNSVTNSEDDTKNRVRPYVVACIPAYNDESTIGRVILSVKKYVNEVIVCDDGSTDYTLDIAAGLGATLIGHNSNLGYGESIISLFDQALEVDADYIITIDPDDQYQESDIEALLDRIKQGDADIVIGSRSVEGGESEAPSSSNADFNGTTGFASNGGVDIADAQSGFRVYTREAIMKLNLTEAGVGVSTEIIEKAIDDKLRIVEVPVSVSYEKNISNEAPTPKGFDVLFNTFKYLSMRRPLVSYGLPGLLSLIISLVFWVWLLDMFTSTQTFSTNVALLAVATSVVGLMLMTTGIILWVTTTLVREKN